MTLKVIEWPVELFVNGPLFNGSQRHLDNGTCHLLASLGAQQTFIRTHLTVRHTLMLIALLTADLADFGC